MGGAWVVRPVSGRPFLAGESAPEQALMESSILLVRAQFQIYEINGGASRSARGRAGRRPRGRSGNVLTRRLWVVPLTYVWNDRRTQAGDILD